MGRVVESDQSIREPARGAKVFGLFRLAGDDLPGSRAGGESAEIGAGWSKRSNEGRDYLSVKLDDPSFNAPIYANLFEDEDGKSYTLIWSRSRKQNSD